LESVERVAWWVSFTEQSPPWFWSICGELQIVPQIPAWTAIMWQCLHFYVNIPCMWFWHESAGCT
jgi:hypothetical protein